MKRLPAIAVTLVLLVVVGVVGVLAAAWLVIGRGAPTSSTAQLEPGLARPQAMLAPDSSAVDVVRALPRGPGKNPYDLATRFKGAPPSADTGLLPQPAVITDPVGTRRQFTATDLVRSRQISVDATLRLRGNRAVMWVADSLNVSDADLKRSLDEFESTIYPADMQNIAGRDLWANAGGPVITILNASIPGVAGYFSSSDGYPAAIQPGSNQLNMFFMSVPAVRLGSRGYAATLAHEFQHMLHAFIDEREEAWMNEGLSELAADLAGYGPSGFVEAFVSQPNTTLTRWSDESSGAAPHYGAGYLFARYLYERFNDRLPISVLVNDRAPGIEGVDRYVKAAGLAGGFDEVYRDWVLANRLDLPAAGLGYQRVDVRIAPRGEVSPGSATRGTANQFAAAYYTLARGVSSLEFSGNPQVGLVPVPPRVGPTMWWSNRGDTMDSRMQREVDLRGVPAASLTFWSWHEIEKPWDFGYVTVSADGGRTWTVVPGRGTTTENPLGLAYGPGITGATGDWKQERFDLTPWAGQRVLLAFEFVTDEAVNQSGWLVDDIAISEIGWRDEDGGMGWTTSGWVSTDGVLPQRWSVEVFGVRDGRVERAPVAVGADGKGRLDLADLSSRVDRMEIAVAPATPITSQPASFELSVR